MKIVVVGGTGRLGSALCARLSVDGQEVLAAAPSTGVDAMTGVGLAEALAGADVVVDVSNAPAFVAETALRFFTTSTGNLLRASATAGVGHYLLVSIVGADELPDGGYLRAKIAQEALVRESGQPYTILRATQFIEFADAIVASLTVDGQVRVPDASLELVAVADVAAELARLAGGAPRNAIGEIGGPQIMKFAQVAELVGADPVIVDPAATYFGAAVGDRSLVSGPGAAHGTITLAEVLRAADR